MENILVGPYGETCPGCYGADQATNIKDEDISDAKDEEDPAPITIREIKIEPDVSLCLCPMLGRYYGYAEMPNFFVISVCLAVCTHETTSLLC
jgi:hypothetical protein